ncbi:MAG: YfbK domain-containing protein [Bacteroidota bacterium]
MKKKYCFILFYMFFLSVTAQNAPGYLVGEVINATSGEPYPAANVVVSKDGDFYAAIRINEDGTYKIPQGLEPRKYEISLGIRELGNVPVCDVTIESDKTSVLNIMVGENYVDSDNLPFPEIPRETYKYIKENDFIKVSYNPVSTFSSDVDAASYGVVKSFIETRQKLPPKYITRIEELINYFDYNYPNNNEEDKTFLVYSEYSDCPWNSETRLLHVAITSAERKIKRKTQNNLVFLIDVSGSMQSPEKLPLVKDALKMLIEELDSQDEIAIVIYAGASGLFLPSTPISQKERIIESIEKLEAGGSTAGAEGIQLAYKIALENYNIEGNNRIILVTDGDFNVGVTSDAELVDMIKENRKSNIYITIAGFGYGNYQDNKLEEISNAGNGNYFFINDKQEVRKFFVDGVEGVLNVAAKDVKFQIEFNPYQIAEYRLIGYENRHLENQDFADITKDAGDVGIGMSVTAIYEVKPVNNNKIKPQQDRYRKTEYKDSSSFEEEIAFFKISYLPPWDTAQKIVSTAIIDNHIPWSNSSDRFKLSACVGLYGMLLNNSKYSSQGSYDTILHEIKSLTPDSKEIEQFFNLVAKTKMLSEL